LLPKQRRFKSVINGAMDAFPAELRQRMFQRVYIGGQSTAVLPVAAELREAGAGVLFSIAQSLSSKIKLFSVNYVNPFFPASKEEVGEAVRRSADVLNVQEHEDVIGLLDVMADLIVRRRLAGNDDVSLMASTLVAADL